MIIHKEGYMSIAISAVVVGIIDLAGFYFLAPHFPAVAGLLFFVTLILFYPITLWLGKTTAGFFIGLNVFNYYISNFGQIFLIIVFSGVAIGSLSSFLAVRKYLKV